MTVTLTGEEYQALLNAKAMAEAEARKLIEERIAAYHAGMVEALRKEQIAIAELYKGDPYDCINFRVSPHQNEFRWFLAVLKEFFKQAIQ